jgi:beta-1,4-mannosyl-glycoprotein beta-1,4-N-acetylglucosaminyltransferase
MKKPKIYDCILFSNEVELLDLRFKMLDKYVDVFVLLESPMSFHGEPKEMVSDSHKHIFDNPKVRHVVYEDLPYIGNVDGLKKRSKANEIFARDCSIRGLYDAEDDDIIMISDVDELPNMEKVMSNLHRIDDENIHKLDYPEYPYLGLQMPTFFYYVDYISNKPYVMTIISKFKNYKNPGKLRKRRVGAIKGVGGPNLIMDAGWHYSFLGGIERIQNKLSTLGSIHVCTDEFRNNEHLEKCLDEGFDVLKRKGVEIKPIDPIKNGPEEMKWFIGKYPNLCKGKERQ